MIPIIDAHLDLAWNALGWNRDLTEPVDAIRRHESDMTDDNARGHATVSLVEMRRADVRVCLGTLIARANPQARDPRRVGLDSASQEIAFAIAQGQLAYYRMLEQQGQVRIIASAEQLNAHWQHWGANPDRSDDLPGGIILSMEGADPIISARQAEAWFSAGLRVASLAHYGHSVYAAGTGETGPLTPAGRELLTEFDRLGLILDATHLSDRSFREALDRFQGRVLATHNNCRTLVPGERQFSDEQIRALIARNAVIGCALDASMLYPGFKTGQTPRENVRLEAVADHIDHICQVAGNCRHVGIGSDLDGGFGSEQTPCDLDTIADLQKLAPILTARAYRPEDVQAVLHNNWMRFLRHALPR